MIKLAPFFEYVNGPDNDEDSRIVVLKEEPYAPKWLKEALYACHADKLPDNWVYATCYAVACALDERDAKDSTDSWVASELHNFVDSQVDIYTHAIFQWAADFAGSRAFADAEEQSEGEYESIEQHIQALQYWVIDSIACTFALAVGEAEAEEHENAVNDAANNHVDAEP